jgi:hypothetical protein
MGNICFLHPMKMSHSRTISLGLEKTLYVWKLVMPVPSTICRLVLQYLVGVLFPLIL